MFKRKYISYWDIKDRLLFKLSIFLMNEYHGKNKFLYKIGRFFLIRYKKSIYPDLGPEAGKRAYLKLASMRNNLNYSLRSRLEEAHKKTPQLPKNVPFA